MVPSRLLRRLSRCFFVAASLFALLGCGSGDKRSVTGKVSLEDGQPFAGAVIDFAAKDGVHGGAGLVKDDGTYVVTSEKEGDGVPPGAYRVRILPPEEDETGNADDDDPGFRKRKRPKMPRRYQSFETSQLEFTVADSGENTFDITVKKQ